jgi:hypothetical protein
VQSPFAPWKAFIFTINRGKRKAENRATKKEYHPLQSVGLLIAQIKMDVSHPPGELD